MFVRTERLLLRPSWPEDSEALYDSIADESIVRNLARAPWPYALHDAREFAATEREFHYPNFLLMQRTDGAPRLVGGCGLGEDERGAELGYWIAQPYWGLGYATEAARAVIGVAKALGHRRLVARHFIDNPASGRVLRKLGFSATGKTEIIQSKGRPMAAPCAVYARDLDNEDGDAFAGDMSMLPNIRYIMAMRAA